MARIIVAVVCQQPLFRAGIERTLAGAGDIAVLGAGDINRRVLSNLDKMLPDVVIVDVDDSTDEFFQVVQDIKQHLPNIGIIVISRNDDDSAIFRALKSQASAFLTREVPADELISTVKRVAAGEYPINETLVNRPRVASKVVEQFQSLALLNSADSLMAPLTAREIQVLDFVARGYQNKQIADELKISEQTIKSHITSVLRKLNANSRTEAVVRAIQKGLISVR
jgi:DNA-binding NarL/FixJ family response regulator